MHSVYRCMQLTVWVGNWRYVLFDIAGCNFQIWLSYLYTVCLNFFAGNVQELTNPSPETSLLEHLRLALNLTGAKLSCNAGGCGACTVTISRIDFKGEGFFSVSVSRFPNILVWDMCPKSQLSFSFVAYPPCCFSFFRWPGSLRC